MMNRRSSVRNARGYILPLSVLLVLMLAISGTSFMHLDFLERRMSSNETYNHGAFYLASAGIERAREAFKLPLNDLVWTSVLSDVAQTDPAPDPRLCPDPSRGCVIPPFGPLVISPDAPFAPGLYETGQYAVRAFNNEPGLIDTDQRLTFRSLGQVRGEEKVLEFTVAAGSGLSLINCQGEPGSPCPTDVHGNPIIDPAEGREPSSSTTLPFMDPPLSDPGNFYRDPSNLPWVDSTPIDYPDCPVPGLPLTLGPASDPLDPSIVQIQAGRYYHVNCEVIIQNTGEVLNIVVFGEHGVDVRTGTTLRNGLAIGADWVRLRGGATIYAYLPYPAIISGGGGLQADANATIYGTVYTEGIANFNPINLHGVLIGVGGVEVQGGAGTIYTDDHDTDPNYIKYYAIMPGFEYTNGQLGNYGVGGSWRECDPQALPACQ